MAENKTLNVRIINKNDSFDAWQDSSFILKKGEIALAEVTVAKNTDNPNSPTLYVPTYLMKIGDGSKTFKQLSWLHAPAADVYDWAKKENPTIAELPGNLKTAIEELQAAVGDGGSVAEAITGAIEALDVTDEAVEHQFVTAVSETNGKIEVTRRTLASDDISDFNNAVNALITTAISGKLDKSEFNDFVTNNTNAIAAAKQAGDNAQADVDALETNVGTISDRVSTIEGDYLKASDKEALQTQINTIMNNPDTDKVIDSIAEFTQYITEHADVAEGFRADIDQNKKDIAANTKAIEDQASANATTYETKTDASNKLDAAKEYADELLEQAKQYADNGDADTTYTAKADGGLKLEGTEFSIDDSITFIFDGGSATTNID